MVDEQAKNKSKKRSIQCSKVTLIIRGIKRKSQAAFQGGNTTLLGRRSAPRNEVW